MDNETLFTPVIIVSYRTPDDVAACLRSLDKLKAETNLTVHLCENGGEAAWSELCAALLCPDGPCIRAEDVSMPLEMKFSHMATLRLRQSGRLVLAAMAPENLGYAGGINSWLRPLLALQSWAGCWILNPDTSVEDQALTELVAQASTRKLGMVGSRIMVRPTDIRVACWGLRWRPITASGCFIGQDELASVEPDSENFEELVDAVSGASCYLTRPCVEDLYPLDEAYFLFFEDFDWGARARRAGHRLGYAHHSVVIHSGGNSIGTPSHGATGSPLAVYLGFRNRLLYVRAHHPSWWLWTALISCLHAVRLVRRGGFGPAVSGLWAGLRRQTGRPERLIANHKVRGPRPHTTSS